MKANRNCPICKKDFEYIKLHDSHMAVCIDEKIDNVIICHDCYSKRCNAEGVDVDGHRVCAKKGCSNDAYGFSKYCSACYDKEFPAYPRSK